MNTHFLQALAWMQTKLAEDARGAGLAEYALLLVLVAVAVFTALQTLGTDVSGVFTNISGKLTN